MNTCRIGVLSSTHVPDLLPSLPADIFTTFAGVDLIVHLGDVSSEDALRDLGSIAPVIALRGEHDYLPLPSHTLLHVQGLRLALVHGKPALYRGLASTASGRTPAGGERWWSALLEDELDAITHVDAIIFGYDRRPLMARHEGVLLFNPGGVYQRTVQTLRDELANGPALPRRLALQRQLEQAEKSGDAAVMAPTVGLLSIADGVIRAEVVSIAI